ncbi:hypothetical protein ABBQ32_007640 [Trebouxia sp. C0010 RCD-2024]
MAAWRGHWSTYTWRLIEHPPVHVECLAGQQRSGRSTQAASTKLLQPDQVILVSAACLTELLCGDQLLLERSTGVSKLAGVIYHSRPGAHPKLVCQGSGLVAAVRLGHSAAGFDLSENQVDASQRRLQQLSLKEMRAHSAHKKAAKLAVLKSDSPHEAQAAQEASVPDSPAGSQDVDGDEDDQDPEYREGDEGQERDEGREAEYDEGGRSDMEAEFDDAEVFGDND